jgi:hypothetical protein
MMHIYDRDGAIHAYRLKRNRKDRNGAILFIVGCVCALVFIVCASLVGLSMVGR